MAGPYEVWIVDDDHAIRWVLEKALSQAEFTPRCFDSADKVLARIKREEPAAIVVPNAAVHTEGCCTVVFVCDKDFLKDGSLKIFNVRKVRIGATDDRRTEIIAGLKPGERIVTAGSGMLLSELLRGGLGEGCACHGAKKD